MPEARIDNPAESPSHPECRGLCNRRTEKDLVTGHHQDTDQREQQSDRPSDQIDVVKQRPGIQKFTDHDGSPGLAAVPDNRPFDQCTSSPTP
jgi:hypothetical protein